MTVKGDPLSVGDATGWSYCESFFSLDDVEALRVGLTQGDCVFSVGATCSSLSDVFSWRGFFTGDLGIFS